MAGAKPKSLPALLCLHGAGHRGQQSIEHHPHVHPDVEHNRNLAHDPDARKEIYAGLRQDESNGCAQKRDHQALGQQLPDQATAPGSDRQAHGDLARACPRPAQQQVGDIGAGNQQHDSDQPEQHARQQGVKRRIVHSHLKLGPHGRRVIAIRVRVGLFEPLPNHGSLGVGACEAQPGLQAPLHEKAAVAALLQEVAVGRAGQAGPHHHRNVEGRAVILIDSRERLGRDTNDGESDTVQVDGLSDCIRRGCELGPPQVITDNDHRIAAGDLVFVGPEAPPDLRLHVENAEGVGRGQEACLHLRQHFFVFREPEGSHLECSQALERPALVPVVDEVRVGHACGALAAMLGADSDHLRRPGHGQRPQQHRVREAEDGGICTDSQGQ